MSVTSLFQALTQTTTPPMFMAKTDREQISTRRIQRRCTLIKCGRTTQTAETMSTEDRLQRTSTWARQELLPSSTAEMSRPTTRSITSSTTTTLTISALHLSLQTTREMSTRESSTPPYGETWIEKTSNTGLEYLPYRFTGKEIDEETGLYYYGARYLDPRYSRWISTDPALGEYIPGAGKATASEAGSLPGIGGIFNTANLQLYHYAGNNPIKYTDPDGRIQFQVQAKYTMQDTNWGSRQLTGTTEESNTLAKAGCAVTLAANLFNTLGFSDYNPAKVNKEFVTSGAINWESVGKKLGMQVEAVKNTQLTKSILNKQNQDKNTGYLTFVNVNYESGNHDHWVGVTGITQKDGKDYLIISQTSENDNAVGKDNLRGKQGWLKDDNGNILVPVSETKGYLNFKASIVYE